MLIYNNEQRESRDKSLWLLITKLTNIIDIKVSNISMYAGENVDH